MLLRKAYRWFYVCLGGSQLARLLVLRHQFQKQRGGERERALGTPQPESCNLWKPLPDHFWWMHAGTVLTGEHAHQIWLAVYTCLTHVNLLSSA